MQIGFTERGDAGRDLSWVKPCKERKVDGAIIITKTLTNDCGYAILELHQEGFPIILHATITGWGNTTMEPKVYDYKIALTSLKALINEGFPKENITLRIDPILPTKEGIERATNVIEKAHEMGLIPGLRVRISIIDEYQHAKRRFHERNIPTCYPDKVFGPNNNQIQEVANFLKHINQKYNIQFETCAEPKLKSMLPKDIIIERGCISETDLKIMKLPIPENVQKNGQNRYGCQCLAIKKELLKHKHPCRNNCAYCFWKD